MATLLFSIAKDSDLCEPNDEDTGEPTTEDVSSFKVLDELTEDGFKDDFNGASGTFWGIETEGKLA